MTNGQRRRGEAEDRKIEREDVFDQAIARQESRGRRRVEHRRPERTGAEKRRAR